MNGYVRGKIVGFAGLVGAIVLISAGVNPDFACGGAIVVALLVLVAWR